MTKEQVVKEKKPFYKKWWVWVVAFLVFAAVTDLGGETEEAVEEAAAPVEEVAAEDKKEEPVEVKSKELTWEETITEIAATDQTETEKFDAVMMLAGDYIASAEEVESFEEKIIEEYKNDNYLKDIEDHEYMLSNIFMTRIIDINYDDEDLNPMDSFALDFHQNAKYTYRGVDAVDSEAVKSNEEQMDKTLSLLQ